MLVNVAFIDGCWAFVPVQLMSSLDRFSKYISATVSLAPRSSRNRTTLRGMWSQCDRAECFRGVTIKKAAALP